MNSFFQVWEKRSRDLRAKLKHRDPGLKLSTEDIRELLLGHAMKGGQMLWRCWYCRDVMDHGTVGLDHNDPLALGGQSTKENLVPCCKLCNTRKRDIGGKEYAMLRAMVSTWPQEMQAGFWARLSEAPAWRNWKGKEKGNGEAVPGSGRERQQLSFTVPKVRRRAAAKR